MSQRQIQCSFFLSTVMGYAFNNSVFISYFSLDMLRRAAMTLLNLARHSDNRPLFVQHEPRLLQLVMSQILEQKVAAMVAQVLYQCSTPDSNSSSQCSQQKYLYASNMDTFYTPLFSRSRNPPQSHVG